MRALLVALLLAVSTPAWALLCDGRNSTLEARAKHITGISGMLAKSLDRIETVPPDVSAYIEREEAAALDQQREARFNLVISNPFYRAHEVQGHYKIVRENLEAARTANSVADQVVHLSEALSHSSELKEALSSYYDYDASRQQRVLGQDGVKRASFTMTVRKSMILEALQCGVRQMREPQ
ncbi:hypothetical protein AAII07_31945 [Microvirga sp. 0TCS3.31]